MDRLFELLLLDSLASAAAARQSVPEDRPDNFFVLPPDNRVWQEVFKKCTEEHMVVGVEFTTADDNQRPIRAAILRLARNFNRQAIFLRAPIGSFSTHDQVWRLLYFCTVHNSRVDLTDVCFKYLILVSLGVLTQTATPDAISELCKGSGNQLVLTCSGKCFQDGSISL